MQTRKIRAKRLWKALKSSYICLPRVFVYQCHKKLNLWLLFHVRAKILWPCKWFYCVCVTWCDCYFMWGKKDCEHVNDSIVCVTWISHMVRNLKVFGCTPSVPLYKVYLFFQKSNECNFDQVFKNIYQYPQKQIYIIQFIMTSSFMFYLLAIAYVDILFNNLGQT